MQIQNAGTLAGNLCTASPAADGAPCLLTLDTQVELLSVQGTRILPLSDFLTGARQTARRSDEIGDRPSGTRGRQTRDRAFPETGRTEIPDHLDRHGRGTAGNHGRPRDRRRRRGRIVQRGCHPSARAGTGADWPADRHCDVHRGAGPDRARPRPHRRHSRRYRLSPDGCRGTGAPDACAPLPARRATSPHEPSVRYPFRDRERPVRHSRRQAGTPPIRSAARGPGPARHQDRL